MKSYTLLGLHEKYGIRRSTISQLIKSGFIAPTRGKQREYRFSFHDLVLLRMAQDLVGAGVSTQKLNRFLKQLARTLPLQSTAGMRITTAGHELVVRQDGRLRNGQGQLVLDFTAAAEVETAAASNTGPVRQLRSPSMAAPPALDAWAHFERAEALVEQDAAAAAAHYRQAAEMDPGLLEAWVNLSCVLLDAGQAIEAYACCQEGLLHHPNAALLLFNQGVALEEMRQSDEALASYEQALSSDPTLSDAHYNAGRLAEALGRKREAIRHFSAYRRMQHR